MIFWGPNYKARWFEFRETALFGEGSADLEHPIEGTVRCDFLQGTSNSTHSRSSAIVADLEFVEDSTDLLPFASPEVVLAEAQAAVERSSLEQQTDMSQTVQRVSRTEPEIRIQLTTLTQGIFTILNTYSLFGTDLGTNEPVAVCPELSELYAEGAAFEAAKEASIAARSAAL